MKIPNIRQEYRKIFWVTDAFWAVFHEGMTNSLPEIWDFVRFALPLQQSFEEKLHEKIF